MILSIKRLLKMHSRSRGKNQENLPDSASMCEFSTRKNIKIICKLKCRLMKIVQSIYRE